MYRFCEWKITTYHARHRPRWGRTKAIYFGWFIPIAPTWSIGYPWNISFHFNFLIWGLLRRVISPSQGRCLHTGQHKHRINVYTDIHVLIWIRTHDPRVRASKGSWCLRPRGHCDRHSDINETTKGTRPFWRRWKNPRAMENWNNRRRGVAKWLRPIVLTRLSGPRSRPPTSQKIW
jgi:hypothetical protein